MYNRIVSQNKPRDNGILRKEHYLAGFTADLEEGTTIIRRHGSIAKDIDGKYMVYGSQTDPEDIYKDIACVIETEKAVEIESVRSFFEPGELIQGMRQAYREAGGLK